jgi:hypothetical protein
MHLALENSHIHSSSYHVSLPENVYMHQSQANKIFLPSKEFTFIVTMRLHKKKTEVAATDQIPKLIWDNDSEHSE